jgi:hypothetical protein
MMIQMMDIRSGIRKTPFFGRISPEKMINRIFNPNSLPNDLSSSEYSKKTTLELQNSNFTPLRWLYNPATTVGKNCAFNPPFAKNRQKPQSEPNAAAIPPKKSSRSNFPAPLPAAPEHLVASESEMAPKNLSVVGGAGIQLCQQTGDKYLTYKFPSNRPGWKIHWFYIKNHAPHLPTKSNRPL